MRSRSLLLNPWSWASSGGQLALWLLGGGIAVFLLTGLAGSARAVPVGACSGSLKLLVGESCSYSIDPAATNDLILGEITFADFSPDGRTLTWTLSVTSVDVDLPAGTGIEAAQVVADGEAFPLFNVISATGSNETGGVDIISITSGPLFNFGVLPSTPAPITAGQISDQFFITYTSAVVQPGTANFMLRPNGFADQNVFVGFVPEPSTGLLVGGGLGVLGLAARRRRQA